MWLLSVSAFLLLGGYLLLMAMRFGVPDMVSDTFYQLQGTYGSEIVPFKKPMKLGWLFTIVMVVSAFLMMMCMLDCGKGVSFMAFLGCVGLCFVGCAPNYCDKDEYKVHKAGAVTAAIGCVGWCLSVCWWVTLVISVIYLAYLALSWFALSANRMWHISANTPRFHPWYWAEVSAFVDVFLTYWISCYI